MCNYTFSYNYKENIQQLTLRCAKQADIDNVKWPEGMTELYIAGDYIDHLEIPEGVEIVNCSRLGLKSIKLPDSLNFLYCNDNFLKHVELPRNIEIVELSGNYLENISFREPPSCIGIMDLTRNDRLVVLDFEPPASLEVLKIDYRLRYYGAVNHKLIKVVEDMEAINELMKEGSY